MPFVSITRLRIRAVRFLPAFLVDTLLSARQVKRAERYLGGRMLADRRQTYWTMTAWTDAAAMRAFTTAGPHRRAWPPITPLCTREMRPYLFRKASPRQPDIPRPVVFDAFIHVVDTLSFLASRDVLRRTIETHVVGGSLHAVTLTLAGDGFSAIGTRHRNSGLDEERLDVIGDGARHTVLNLADRMEATVHNAITAAATGFRSVVNAGSRQCANNSCMLHANAQSIARRSNKPTRFAKRSFVTPSKVPTTLLPCARAVRSS